VERDEKQQNQEKVTHFFTSESHAALHASKATEKKRDRTGHHKVSGGRFTTLFDVRYFHHASEPEHSFQAVTNFF